MTWAVLMGICMLFIHIVAREDPNRTNITIVALASAWIVLANLIAFLLFTMDKCFAISKAAQLSEALVCYIFAIGGVVGGWLALIITCYKPPSSKRNTARCSRFMCYAMICTCIGIACDVVLVLRVILPNIDVMYKLVNNVADLGH